MNWLDGVFIVILVLTALVGLWKGLIKLVFAYVALILGLILGGYAGNALGNAFGGGAVATIVCFAILFIVIALAIYLILTRIVRRFITWGPIAWVDRLGGLAFGVAIGFAMCGFIVWLLGLFITVSLPNIPPAELPEMLKGAFGTLHSTQASVNNLLSGSALTPAVESYFSWIASVMPVKLETVKQFFV